MSKKGTRRQKRKGPAHPRPYQSPGQADYVARRRRVVAEVGETYQCHVHTQRIRRPGMRDDLVVQIAGRKTDNVTRVLTSEAVAILRLFQAEFGELGKICYRMERIR